MKGKLKFIIPIALIVFLVVAFIWGRTTKKTGQDLVVQDSDINKPTINGYVAERYQSNLLPKNDDYTADGLPLNQAIRIDNAENGDSNYILIEDDDNSIYEVYSKQELLQDHSPTTNISSGKLDYYTEEANVVINNEVSVPITIAYDEDLVYRTITDPTTGISKELYAGALYGKWSYSFSKEEKELYHIDSALVIASFYRDIILSTEIASNLETYNQTVLSQGDIDYFSNVEYKEGMK